QRPVPRLQHRQQPPGGTAALHRGAGGLPGPEGREEPAAAAARRRAGHLHRRGGPAAGHRLLAVHADRDGGGAVRGVVPGVLRGLGTSARFPAAVLQPRVRSRISGAGRIPRPTTLAAGTQRSAREPPMAMKQLSDEQLATFDTEYVTQALWDILAGHIDRTHPDGRFTFLDIGGGNGVFADRLLAAYPASEGTVLDNSRLLLDRNRPDSRKTLIEESAENLQRLDRKYDLVFFNWVLHHLVGDGYGQSVRHVDQTLRKAAALLTPNGHISIFENMYNGLVVDNAPSH